jgi:hypothetical protein
LLALDRFVEDYLGCGDDAHIEFDGFDSADALDFPLL